MSDILYFINPASSVKSSAVVMQGVARFGTVTRLAESVSSVSGKADDLNNRFKAPVSSSSSISGDASTLDNYDSSYFLDRTNHTGNINGNLYVRNLNYLTASGTEYNNGFKSGNYTINWANSSCQTLSLSGNTTLTLSGALSGSRLQLFINQDAVGSRTITWPSNVRWSMGGTSPTLTTTASGVDMVCFYNKDSIYYGTAATTFL